MLPGLTHALFAGGLRLGPPLGIDANTKSLVKFDGLVGATARTFVSDYAKPSRVWTAAGSSTTNGRFGGTSVDNDGSGIFSPSSDTDFDITGDFTIDFWMQPEGVAAGNSGCIVGRCNSGSFGPFLFLQSSGGVQFYSTSNGSAWDIASGQGCGACATGVWAHYAVTRQGNVWTTWRNGVLVATWTSALVPWANGLPVSFGCYNPSGSPWGGFVDEWRFSNICRYTAAFTPQPYPYFSGLNGQNDAATRLLLHGEDFIDSAVGAALGAPHNFTTNGTAVVSAALAKFGSKSLRFDGSTNCLIYTPYNSSLDLMPRDADWTVDFWYYRVALPASYGHVIGHRSANNQIAPWMILDNSNGHFTLYGSTDASTWNAFNNFDLGAIPTGQWVHFALVHDNSLPDATALRSYINGAQSNATNWTKGMVLYPMGNVFSIGGLSDVAGVSCYMDEIRFSSVARWNANFTPPTAPYALDPAPTATPNDSLVKILLHLDGPVGTATYTDVAFGGAAKTWTGAALISAAQSKFGGASVLCAAGQALSTPDHADFRLGSGDFTIDCWFMLTGGAGTRRFVWGHCNSSAAATAIATICEVNASNQLYCTACVGGAASTVTAVTVPILNTWYHVAVVRQGNVLKLFLNGVLESTVALTGAVNPGSGIYAIGALGAYPSGLNFVGHIDEYRLSVGVARWTSNFRPPTNSYGVPSGPATQFTVTVPASVNKGSPTTVSVQARDGSGGVTTNYTGTVHFTSTDGTAALPANTTLTSGYGSFPVTFNATGNFTVTATDTVTGTINGTSGSVAVTVRPPQTVAFAGTGTWTVPADWNNANNSIELIGGGSGGSGYGSYGGAGGGGGAYAKIANVTMTPGSVKNYSSGAGGVGGGSGLQGGAAGDTWLRTDGGSGAPANTSQGVMAKGASSQSPVTIGTGALGGTAAASIGTTKFDGGNGGDGDTGGSMNGGGGGGAAGLFGAGANGSAGNFSNGGPGGQGDAGHGGAGGAVPGGGGGAGVEWTATAGGTCGSGGGGGGGGGGAPNGGSAGVYGAGGGGGAFTGGTAGTVGLVVIKWTPA